MVETIQPSGLWHVSLAQKDLIEQAGLKEEDFEFMFTHFLYKDRKVIISHIYNQHLVVSMEGKEDDDLKRLMDAFSVVVAYKPFCKYNLNMGGKAPILPTYEWDKADPKGRFDELSKKPNIADLVKI
ncbi:MAG: hypothetical protein NTY99_00215 [DPANN group archaeon]|nr:hypothetical protein [DPANN group archaeon]